MKQVLSLSLFISQFAFAQTVIVTELADLPGIIYETSGLENGPDDCFWTHNDSDNGEFLYCVDTTGTIQRTVTVFGDENDDWEEIAKDEQGNLYIGNFGNNDLNRNDLRIVKIPSIDTCTGITFVTDTIHFSYPDQLNLPPVGDYGNFDMEAMFWHEDSLHLFSKDRSDPSTGYTKHYTLPTQSGTYIANFVDSFETEHPSFFLAITAADIREDGEEMVLLSADRVWLFSNYIGTNYFGGDVTVLDLSVFSQKEGISYRNGFLYITDEQSFGLGGKIYRVDTRLFVGVENEYRTAPRVIYSADLELEKILFSSRTEKEWRLLDLDGRRVQESSFCTDQVLRSEFTTLGGVYILQVLENKQLKSATIIRL